MYGLALVCEEGLAFASLKVLSSTEASNVNAYINCLHRYHRRPVYVSILQQTLLPIVRSVYPDDHRFMQDNDPEQGSNCSGQVWNLGKRENIYLLGSFISCGGKASVPPFPITVHCANRSFPNIASFARNKSYHLYFVTDDLEWHCMINDWC